MLTFISLLSHIVVASIRFGRICFCGALQFDYKHSLHSLKNRHFPVRLLFEMVSLMFCCWVGMCVFSSVETPQNEVLSTHISFQQLHYEGPWGPDTSVPVWGPDKTSVHETPMERAFLSCTCTEITLNLFLNPHRVSRL